MVHADLRGLCWNIQDSVISVHMEKLPKARGEVTQKRNHVWLLQRQKEDRTVKILKSLALAVRIKLIPD